MCGIVGAVVRHSDSVPDTHSRYRKAVETLHHRGPDAAGQFTDRNVWLAHTRLSILDLSAAGNQPMQSTDGRFVISYNGEVYNFRSLAADNDLQDLRSGTDTEVVLRLFEKHGVESLLRLNGMFAFVVYDSERRRLWLVRDRLGIKPLYYNSEPNRLVFSSEIKGIIALSPRKFSCNVDALHEWLYYGNSLGERTMYEGIKELLPGHYLEIDVDSFEVAVRAYWSLERHVRTATDSTFGDHNFIEETRRLLEQAVQRQLVSDVPVGVFLSGGIDSSAIVAFASRHYTGRLATYSVGFDFNRDDAELPRARRVASRYGTDHHEIHIRGADVGDLIEKLVCQHDAPFSDAANIPLYLMASEVSRDIKVVMQGDGGDELFCGYRRYSTLSYYRVLRYLARAVRHARRRRGGSALYHRAQRYLQALGAEDPATTMALLLTVEGPSSTPTAVFASPLREKVERTDPFARYRECQRMVGDQGVCNQMSLVDLMIVLPDMFLEKVDRSTMAASLEVRVPFLDHDLVSFVSRLPGREKIPWGRKKWLLKKALQGVVPVEVLEGPKRGLTVPYGKWLQGPLKPLFFDNLSRFTRKNAGVLDADHITLLFERTSSGQQDSSFMIWKLLNLMIWANTVNVQIDPAVS